MNLSTTDQRQGVRACSAYAVRINHQDGRVMGKGRTANISENGVLALVDAVEDMEVGQCVLLDMILPGSLGIGGSVTRKVTYVARVANVRYIGHLLGVGLELLSKVRNGH